jgi:serine/threonine protein kinase
MGRVYEGLQRQPRRRVAVKVIRPGLISLEAYRRFAHESELLGRLRHPCIAQIFSAGICEVAGAQLPYFVMEYIPDALPITQYAARHFLPPDAVLEVFRKLCDAVAHGHAEGVIHRDLKPTNILVAPDGAPKIIDFGVARSVGGGPGSMTTLTEMGQLIGTLQYMSPEQFGADHDAIDTRSDVYALGVILYELLTGRPPYEIRYERIFEAARIVRDERPISPARINRKVDPTLEPLETLRRCRGTHRGRGRLSCRQACSQAAAPLAAGGPRLRPPPSGSRLARGARPAAAREPAAGGIGFSSAGTTRSRSSGCHDDRLGGHQRQFRGRRIRRPAAGAAAGRPRPGWLAKGPQKPDDATGGDPGGQNRP